MVASAQEAFSLYLFAQHQKKTDGGNGDETECSGLIIQRLLEK